MPDRRTTLACAAALAALSFSGLSAAQGKYPDQTVKLVVALPAGGSVDMIARALGQKLNASLGVPFEIAMRVLTRPDERRHAVPLPRSADAQG